MKYRSLNRYVFTQAEKLHICQYLIDICGEEPEFFSSELDIKIKEFRRLHSMKKGIINSWMTAFANGEDFKESECPLDALGIARISALIAVGRQVCEGDQEYHQRLLVILNNEIEETVGRRT